jgi:putative transposase
MRKARIKVDNHTAVYHCISRIVGGEYLLDDQAKETFRIFMWQQAEFAGLQVLTYNLMSSHTHILVRVPQPGRGLRRRTGRPGPGTLWTRRPGDTSPPQGTRTGRQDPPQTARAPAPADGRRLGLHEGTQTTFQPQVQRGARPLWHLVGRTFRSSLVEDNSDALRTVAAYIDLNSVRAGLTGDPKDYQYSGYGEAVAGSRRRGRGC